MAYQSVNPFDGESLKIFVELKDKQLEESGATAATRAESRRHETDAARAAVVAKVGVPMERHTDEFPHTLTLAMGTRGSEPHGERAPHLTEARRCT